MKFNDIPTKSGLRKAISTTIWFAHGKPPGGLYYNPIFGWCAKQ